MIKNITIRNFKSLRDVSVTLSPVTVLVGRSGTGKSNFVTAIRFLRDFLITGTAWSRDEFHPELVAPPGSARNYSIEFVVNFAIPGLDDEFTYATKLSFGGDQSEESLRLGNRTLLHHRNGSWQEPPNISPQPNVVMPMLGRLPSVSEAVIAYSALTSGIGCYEFPLGVLSDSRIATKSKPIEGLNDDGMNYLQIIKGIYGNLRDLGLRKAILANLSNLNRSVVALELDSITAPENALVTHQFNGTRVSFSLAQESEGFRRFLAHLLAIYQEPPKQLLIFEEPENAIYPGALELLAWELKSVPTTGRGQVILTTHSPGLLDHFDVESVRVVEMAEGATRIAPVADYQLQSIRDGLLRTGELLTVDPAHSQKAEAATS